MAGIQSIDIYTSSAYGHWWWHACRRALKCTTGSAKLDSFLKDGIETQAITEIAGEFGRHDRRTGIERLDSFKDSKTGLAEI